MAEFVYRSTPVTVCTTALIVAIYAISGAAFGTGIQKKYLKANTPNLIRAACLDKQVHIIAGTKYAAIYDRSGNSAAIPLQEYPNGLQCALAQPYYWLFPDHRAAH